LREVIQSFKALMYIIKPSWNRKIRGPRKALEKRGAKGGKLRYPGEGKRMVSSISGGVSFSLKRWEGSEVFKGGFQVCFGGAKEAFFLRG